MSARADRPPSLAVSIEYSSLLEPTTELSPALSPLPAICTTNPDTCLRCRRRRYTIQLRVYIHFALQLASHSDQIDDDTPNVYLLECGHDALALSIHEHCLLAWIMASGLENVLERVLGTKRLILVQQFNLTMMMFVRLW